MARRKSSMVDDLQDIDDILGEKEPEITSKATDSKVSIVSSYKGNLRLPDGTILKPGERAEVNDWGKLSSHKVVKMWLDAGIIST